MRPVWTLFVACGFLALSTAVACGDDSDTEDAAAGTPAGSGGAGAAGGGEVLAPMPGRVVKVIAKQGDHVEAGAPMVVVEAMKMENELCCDAPGIVQQVHVEAGQSVDGGALLVQLSPITGDG